MICIIGGSGFVGTRLCRRLAARGVDFTIVDKTISAFYPERCVIADVRDLQSLRVAVPRCVVIVNLAAEHRDDVRPESLYHEVNVIGAAHVCQVAEEVGCEKIVFTSSVACYGFVEDETGEDGELKPFNEYGRTKLAAEAVYREWQVRSESDRALVIVRPTVIFGEGNRGNVFNLLKLIHSRRFVMIGAGRNKKSMAYVENVASFIEHSFSLGPGVSVVNYVDKPDLEMNALVSSARAALGLGDRVGVRIPYALGLLCGLASDCLSWILGRSFPISSIRVKKFCASTQFSTAASRYGFVAPVSLDEGLRRTLAYEFLENHDSDHKFYTE